MIFGPSGCGKVLIDGRVVSRPKEMVEEILKEVDLSGFEDKMPDRLSGGERQRVALARSLVPEPLSSFDEELNSRVRRVILNLHK